jgi:hypothetical protein
MNEHLVVPERTPCTGRCLGVSMESCDGRLLVLTGAGTSDVSHTFQSERHAVQSLLKCLCGCLHT